jgi:flap endonuclease-1
MGIHGLLDYLRKEAPEYVQQVDVRALGVRRVALDGHQWMTMTTKKTLADAYMDASDPWAELTPVAMEACKQAWLRQALQTTCSWLDLGIEPVWVFDGPAPLAKSARKAERAADRSKAVERLEELRTTPVVMGTVGGAWLVPVAHQDIRDKIISLRQQMVGLQPGWQDALVEMLTATGTPWVVGTTEGEKVACMLQRAGVVDAVVSNDTDCLVYGCDRVITSPRAVRVGAQVLMSLYARPYILEFLELTDAQFVEFCIACGCDYNTNIPKVGPVKVHELMRTHGSLAAWPVAYKKIPLDQTCLNVDECKRLFAPCTMAECVARSSPSLQMDWEAWARCDTALMQLLGATPATRTLLSTLGYYPRNH